MFLSKDHKKKKYLTIKDISFELNSNISFLNTFSKVIIKVLSNLGLIFSNLLFFSLFITLFNFKNEKISERIIIPPFAYAPIKKGDIAGVVEYVKMGRVIDRQLITYRENIDYYRSKKSFWDWIKGIFNG